MAEVKGEDPHNSEISYSYRSERFSQTRGEREPERFFAFDVEKSCRGFGLPYRTDQDTKTLPFTNDQVQLTDDGRLIINVYKNREETDGERDSTKGMYLDDILALTALVNNSSLKNPKISDFERKGRESITTLLNTILLILDEIAFQKHGYSGSEIEKVNPPVETAKLVFEQALETMGWVSANVLKPIKERKQTVVCNDDGDNDEEMPPSP